MTTIDKNDPCPCGSTKKYKHCCQRKEKKQDVKPTHSAAMVSTWLQLGMQSLRQERLQQAKALYEQVLHANPRQPDALQWLGVIQHKQGNSIRALELISEAIVVSPGNAFCYSTLGNVLKDIGQNELAVESYGKALTIKPDFAEAHNNLGIVLSMQGKLNEAVESYRKAIALIPGYAEALNNLGTALQAQGQAEAALEVYQRALVLTPNFGQAYFNVGNTLHEKTPEQALPYIQKAVALKPDFLEALLTLAKLLHAQGEVDQAKAAYARCYALKASPGTKIQAELMLPPIMGTWNEVLSVRENFERKLAQLAQENIRIDDPLKEYCNTNFHLAYHGVNDKKVQVNVAQFYARACPSLQFVAPHCARPHVAGNRRRIGFLSKFITRHSVALSFSRIVAGLAATGEFDVTLISTVDADQALIQEAYPNFAGQYVRLTADLEKARHEIAALELDVLVYLDIGMEAFSYFLAFARLAPVQCVVGGHPVTTGIPAMDYYLSIELGEVEHAQEHYSERLVKLPYGALYFERPALPSLNKTKIELGLPAEGSIYACPMTLHKLHPDFDAAIERILQLDPTGHVVLFADKKFSAWQKQLERRLRSTISADVRHRVVFIPWVTDPQDFMRVVDASDVILDSFHFGIGTTAIPICSIGTPFVTKPSEFLRGRVGLYYCRLMDLTECVTHDVESYSAKAVSIATIPSERERIKKIMLANNHALFQNDRGVHDMTHFLANVVVPN
ncbi:tetratricopeptide repeat protein [Rhodoferax sp. AJA081-3]|uniref:tetratricopeptide repeat protein n=1 Tax=Rhodoferax sp. AJA081-3 TaxID=2752316 RepID=UPI001ADFBF0E|nr:tetratricopeptide repeat protein [Rhodoferax sp. AJA081-3]QTN26107.1 tetratricopeptide repeat protein [Rhodoferax sp. AJA081-3]